MKRTSGKQIHPSTVRAHLAQSQPADFRPGSLHPDADLLTAFAEDTLLDRERTDILAHLASCPDCRAVVHTAAALQPDRESEFLPELLHNRRPQLEPLPQSLAAHAATPATAPEPRPTRSPFRSWLPGVALAASLLVMSATTILFYRALHTNPANHTQTAATTPAPQLPIAPQPAASEPPVSADKKSVPAAALTAKRKQARTTAPAALSVLPTEEARVGAAAAPPPAPPAGISSSVSLGDLSQSAQNSPPPQQAQLQAELRANRTYQSAMARAKVASRASAPSSTRSVQVQADDAFTRSLETTHPVAGFIAPATARPHFRITGSGQLERSTLPNIWVPVSVSPDARFRVVSISGSDVWAGGDHLRLFHSTDNGLIWTEVHLPAPADHARAVIHIHIDDAQHITVEDDAGRAWTTTDAGATWH